MEIEWSTYVYEIESMENWIIVKVVKYYGMLIGPNRIWMV